MESKGYKVDRQFRIGQREVYLPEIEEGSIDLFPEYTGILLQYWKPDAEARLADEVYAELQTVAPEGLRVLDQSEASDQDSYTVTKEYADKWGLASVEDLAKVTDSITLGGNAELESRPYGPVGLKDSYGIDVAFTPIEDSGGPITVKVLIDGQIQLANIFTADPSTAENNLVPLKDTQGLFLSSHLVPLASSRLDDNAVALINEISAAMTPDDLVTLNTRSTKEQLPADTIAKEWLKNHNFEG